MNNLGRQLASTLLLSFALTSFADTPVFFTLATNIAGQSGTTS